MKKSDLARDIVFLEEKIEKIIIQLANEADLEGDVDRLRKRCFSLEQKLLALQTLRSDTRAGFDSACTRLNLLEEKFAVVLERVAKLEQGSMESVKYTIDDNDYCPNCGRNG